MHDATAPERPRQTRLRKALFAFTVLFALAYLVGLVGSIVGLRWVGERWWLTTVAMYLPRIGFALPLPVVLVVAALWAPRWVLATQALSIYLVLFPLMGLNLGLERAWVSSKGPEIRLLSYNIHYNRRELDTLVAQIRSFAPDVVVLQEAYVAAESSLRAAFTGWRCHLHDQFFVASRWPIQDVYLPPKLRYEGRRTGDAHFVRYTLDTPLGPVQLFNVHPISPREGFDELRDNGFRGELRSGRVFASMARGPIELNALHRQRQIEAVAAVARASSQPVIIAGDTNLPDLSWILGNNLGNFRDGFSSVGRGFGYTFPTKRPWLRIDRVMTNKRLRITDFRVGERGASDHLCVFAAVARDD